MVYWCLRLSYDNSLGYDSAPGFSGEPVHWCFFRASTPMHAKEHHYLIGNAGERQQSVRQQQQAETQPKATPGYQQATFPISGTPFRFYIGEGSVRAALLKATQTWLEGLEETPPLDLSAFTQPHRLAGVIYDPDPMGRLQSLARHIGVSTSISPPDFMMGAISGLASKDNRVFVVIPTAEGADVRRCEHLEYTPHSGFTAWEATCGLDFAPLESAVTNARRPGPSPSAQASTLFYRRTPAEAAQQSWGMTFMIKMRTGDTLEKVTKSVQDLAVRIGGPSHFTLIPTYEGIPPLRFDRITSPQPASPD